MNEQNAKLESLKKRCNVAEKILSILQIIAIVGAVCAFIAGVGILVKAKELNPYLIEGVESGKISLENNLEFDGLFELCLALNEFFPEDDYADPLWISCFVACCTCVAVIVVITLIKKIFTILKEENTPFSEKCMNQIKVSFIVITVCAFLTVSGGSGIIIGLVLFCIYSIFEYGAALQTEIDETL